MLSLLTLPFQDRKISITHLESKFDLYLVLLNNGYKIHMPRSEVNFLNSLLLILWYQLIHSVSREREKVFSYQVLIINHLFIRNVNNVVLPLL